MTDHHGVLAAVRADIARRRADLEALERAARILAGSSADQDAGNGVRGGDRRLAPRRPRVANGSLEHRILGALAEQPQPLQAIVAVAKARKGDVQRTVKAMVAAGQLKQTSGGRWRTYGLPA